MVTRGGASAYDTPELLIKTEDRVEKTVTKSLMDYVNILWISYLYLIIINKSLHASLAALITHLYQILTGIFFAPVTWLEGGQAGLNILWVSYCFTIKFSGSGMLVSCCKQCVHKQWWLRFFCHHLNFCQHEAVMNQTIKPV